MTRPSLSPQIGDLIQELRENQHESVLHDPPQIGDLMQELREKQHESVLHDPPFPPRSAT